MPRPDFVTNEDILRWSEKIDQDLPPNLASDAIIREVCYAGQWLVEQLRELQVPEEIMARLQYTAGKLSFGRDPWDMHRGLLLAYEDNQLDFETDSELLN